MKSRKSILLFITAIFVGGCKCDSYFSNSTNKNIHSVFFEIECHIVEQTKEKQVLEVNLDYKLKSLQSVVQKSINILPVVNETNDTLTFLSNYANLMYTYSYTGKSNSKLNLTLKFKVDSMGIIIDKTICYSKLNGLKKCRFHPILH